MLNLPKIRRSIYQIILSNILLVLSFSIIDYFVGIPFTDIFVSIAFSIISTIFLITLIYSVKNICQIIVESDIHLLSKHKRLGTLLALISAFPLLMVNIIFYPLIANSNSDALLAAFLFLWIPILSIGFALEAGLLMILSFSQLINWAYNLKNTDINPSLQL